MKGDAEATDTKRFTYVFGDVEAFYKTPVQRFLDLQKRADEYLEIRKAFSVEALSDDFFDEYRNQYAEFVKFLTGKKYVKKGNKWVEQVVGEPDEQFYSSFGEDEKLVRDYIKKMMGRIVFLYFLQSKGWLAGNLHYMHDLFHGASEEVKANFLDKVLEPMFFGLLNTKPEDRSAAPLVNGVGVKYIPDAGLIPYLNGGLFQQEQIDAVDSRFPAEMFRSLFDFFDSYNFTIDENDPNDAEVGVDPEMLGKIFENLLEDNKDKGAFYTPKEIVRYMCQESLTAYLQTGIEDEEIKAHIANFVKTYEVEELGGASSELAQSIDQRLKDVKICDPAIGSGAFPMGLLRELYACRKAIEIFDPDNAADIKRHIIQNNIYGVDIEKGAVDIARLRFWLALIIDEKEPMPLPNLDFKIMQGNSLLESFMGVDLNVTSKEVKTGKDTKKTRGVLSLGFEEVDIQKTIQDLVKSYFSITDHAFRAQRRQEIDKYVKDYIKICAAGNKEVQAAVDELEIPNSQFFLWHTYFNDVFEKGGFDIVIANPPYVEFKNLSLDIKKRLVDFQTTKGKYDLYIPFIEFTKKLLNNVGYAIYICPTRFLKRDYGKALRQFIKQNLSLVEFVDFGDKQNFDNAMTYTGIFMFKSMYSVDYNIKYKLGLDSQSVSFDSCKLNQEIWNFSISNNDELLDKIAANKAFLLELCGGIYQGIATGKDSVFLVDEGVINSFNLERDILEPFLKGKNISPYKINWNGLYLIYPYDELGGIISESDLESKYPNVYNYLCESREKLKGRSYFDKSSKLWYELWNQRKPTRFEGEKIVTLDNASCNSFALDSDNYYGTTTVYSLKVVNKCEYSNKYVLGVLNSKLLNYYHQNTSVPQAGGFYRYQALFIKNLPIALPSILVKSRIETLVEEILTLKYNGADTTSLENEIDFLVYHLYGLTYEEVLIVDPDTPITREEYETYQVEK